MNLNRSFLITALFCLLSPVVHAQDKPNIVLVFMDNFGWGEPGFNGGGIIRGAATPQIDSLADAGLRLTNFNVEVQCTPSRSTLMTGRYAIRSGNGTVPLGEGVYGLVQWEVTMAEMLADAGYATGMFGKWHLGRRISLKAVLRNPGSWKPRRAARRKRYVPIGWTTGR
jgi:arylsulfatase